MFFARKTKYMCHLLPFIGSIYKVIQIWERQVYSNVEILKQYNQVFETKMTVKSKIPALGWKNGGTGIALGSQWWRKSRSTGHVPQETKQQQPKADYSLCWKPLHKRQFANFKNVKKSPGLWADSAGNRTYLWHALPQSIQKVTIWKISMWIKDDKDSFLWAVLNNFS